MSEISIVTTLVALKNQGKQLRLNKFYFLPGNYNWY